MARTLNLSGITAGDSLSISVSRGALTAGPVSVPSWGSAGTGGTITITTNRTNLQVAPDSVRFSVDLSASDFDTAGPTGGEIYDARLHELIFLWDFDDAAAGDWTAPVNVLAEWKNRNVAKGPWVAHMYTQPGTYTPSVLVIEPSSGKTATAELEVVIADPDVVFAGTDTVCINPIGDDDFTGKPAGALEAHMDFVTNTDAEWTGNRGSNTKRWLYKRGASYTQRLNINAEYPNIYFGAYGPASARPVINAVGIADAKGGIMYCHGAYGAGLSPVPADIRFSGLRFQGTMDAASEWANQFDANTTNGMVLQTNVDAMVSDCHFDGLHGASFAHQPAVKENRANFHIDGTVLTNFGGQYPFFYGPVTHAGSSLAMTGCRLAQIPDAVDTITYAGGQPENSAGSRAVMRSEWAQYNHVRGCDIYITDSTQPNLKILGTPYAEGAIVNVHSSSFEHGAAALAITGNAFDPKGIERSTVNNIVLDGNIYVAAFCGETAFDTYSTGITIRNWLVIYPAISRHPTALIANRSFFKINKAGTFDPAVVGAAPIRVYNNTLVTERSAAQNNSHVPDLVDDNSGGDYTAISQANNVVHRPNEASPYTAFIPFLTDALWTPRNPGRRDPDTFVLDTAYATPLNAVKSYVPDTGSAALGAATSGSVSYDDLAGTVRSTPDQGAWEA